MFSYNRNVQEINNVKNVRKRENGDKNKQESCAIAKITARCA